MKTIHPFIVGFTAFTIVLIAGAWIVVLPLLRSQAQAQRQLDYEQNAPDTIYESLEKKKGQVALLKQKARSLVPVEPDQSDATVQLESIVKSTGATLTSLTIGSGTKPLPKSTVGSVETSKEVSKEAAKPALEPLSVVIGADGTYVQIQELLEKLVRIERFVQIDQVLVGGAVQSTGGSPTKI